MPDIELVLFDFGGVFTNSPLAAFRTVGPELGIDPTELFELVLGPMHVDTDHPWHQVERGELSLKHASVLIRELSASRGLRRQHLCQCCAIHIVFALRVG